MFSGFTAVISSLLLGIGMTSALLVVISKNPVHSVLFLIATFVVSAVVLLSVNVELLGMLFLIVYVGAIAVLFLFVIMMLNIKLNELTENITKYIPVGIFITLIFAYVVFEVLGGLSLSNPVSLFQASYENLEKSTSQVAGKSLITDTVVQAFATKEGVWNLLLESSDNIEILANLLYGDFFLLFLLASVALLIAMIGAIALTLTKKGNVYRQDIFKQVSQKTLQETIES